ncbi:MAG: hypothetical protein KME45_30730 [Stenomitos rutilans HA7619-LM2]|nr:hypothetical protein [Stenomitos rutilans HA7619-LM2]
MIFLLDANILIDLGCVEGLDTLASLGIAEVLDMVLIDCEHPKQPSLVEDIRQIGVKEITVEQKGVKAAQKYRKGRLSLQDALNLHHAKTFGHTLLTNEQPLRSVCIEEEVPFHGMLWIVEQVHNLQLRSVAQLCNWLQILEQLNRWLPKTELEELRQKLGCSDQKSLH